MKEILAILRVLLGILAGLVGAVFLLNAPYQLANAKFSWSSGGMIMIVSLLAGAAMVWGAWRLIRGPRSRSPAA